MKSKTSHLLTKIFMFLTVCISICCFSMEVHAAQSGSIGSVTWTLDDNQVLTFSGNGTISLDTTWSQYWTGQNLNKNSVLQVRVSEGSKIVLSDCSYMFSNFQNCKTMNLTGFDTGNVTSMEQMFSKCYGLMTLDISGFNTGNVSDMSDMFRECESLTTLDVSHFDTTNATDLSSMFYRCWSLTELNLKSFNTKNVTDMSGMFAVCRGLKQLDISHFDTTSLSSVDSMFYECCSATEIKLPKKLVTQKVKSTWNMFGGCNSLQTIDLSDFDTSNVTNMEGMFQYCYALKEINLSSFHTGNVTNMRGMFKQCTGLTELDLSGFDMGKVTNKDAFLENMSGLERIVTPKYVKDLELPAKAGKIWIDDAKNVYDVNPVTFNRATPLFRVNDTYKITYVAEGTLVDCPTEYGVRTGLTNLGSVSHSCQTFAGWYRDKNYTTKVTSIAKGTTGDLTLHARMTHESSVMVSKNQAAATCSGEGYTGDKYCKVCGALVEKGISIPRLPHDIDKTKGKVIKAATELAPGTIQYSCKNCTYTITEEIPRLETKPAGEEVLDARNDHDIKGSTFVLLQARADKTTSKSIRLKWTKIKGADGYLIYGNKCGMKNRYEHIKTIKSAKTTTYTRKKLKKATYYKFVVVAYKNVGGKKVSVAVSKTIHATTTGSRGNAKAVKVNKTKITLKPGATFKIKASEVKGTKKINIHRSIAFESSNPKIATVTKKGVVKGKKKGTCYVYAYAQNGVYKRIKVKVN